LGARFNRKLCSCFFKVFQLFLLEVFSFFIFVCFSPIFEAAELHRACKIDYKIVHSKKKKKRPIFLTLIVKFCICFVFQQ
jgi:hypothetical protein